MYGYIAAIEAKVSKRFTFGSLNQSPQVNGMDVTIGPMERIPVWHRNPVLGQYAS